jgi:phosphatidylserine/phosphatidylglycerophosphate/cardiolipin synthase-like enzyme
MIRYLNVAICKSIRVTVVTRPKQDFPEKDHMAFQKAQDLLIDSGINIFFKANIHQKFAIMDQKIVWYGSINLLSYGSAQESIMRIESFNIANELMKSMEDS